MLDVEPNADRSNDTRCLRSGIHAPAATPGPTREATTIGPAVSAADISRDDLSGLCLGQYVLGARIGGGGMGRVFHARHRHLKRDLAIKFVAADLSSLDESQRRFEQETLALGALQHPHIVNAVDAGSSDGLQYLVTEFVDGEDLSALVERRGPLPVGEACELIRQAALGLAYSHGRGFVHRDIKPSNLIVNRDGCLKILDFGLVRSNHIDQQLTDDGQTLGTWDFLAPEQAHDSSDVDHRCDIYSLGCTLLYLLSGGVPFGGTRYETAASKLKGHLFDAPAWLRDPPAGIPADLLHLLERMLAKSPDQRLESAADVAEALAQHATPAVSNFVVPAGLQSSSQSLKRPISLAAVCCAWAIVALLCMLIPDGDQAAPIPSHLSTEAGTVKTVHVAAAEGPQETGRADAGSTADPLSLKTVEPDETRSARPYPQPRPHHWPPPPGHEHFGPWGSQHGFGPPHHFGPPRDREETRDDGPLLDPLPSPDTTSP